MATANAKFYVAVVAPAEDSGYAYFSAKRPLDDAFASADLHGGLAVHLQRFR